MKRARLANESLSALEALQDLAFIQKGAAAAKAKDPDQIGAFQGVQGAGALGASAPISG
jgi:hypothetical protein